MRQIECFCTVYGEQFSPSEAEKLTGWAFAEHEEPGSASEDDYDGGLPVTHGWGNYDFGELNDCSDPSFMNWLENVKKTIPVLQRAGAERIVLEFLVAYKGQCNLEAQPDFFAAVARLGLPVTMSCWEDKDLPEPEAIVVE
jgi:hypothetical protein